MTYKKMRATKQKEVILEYLKSVKNHPTAEDVYIGVRKKLPNISLGTIYRNLDKFSKDGEVLALQGEVKRFDGDISFHNHFTCENCGRVFDIFEKNDTKSFKDITKKAKKIGRIKNCQINFSGICNKCV